MKDTTTATTATPTTTTNQASSSSSLSSSSSSPPRLSITVQQSTDDNNDVCISGCYDDHNSNDYSTTAGDSNLHHHHHHMMSMMLDHNQNSNMSTTSMDDGDDEMTTDLDEDSNNPESSNSSPSPPPPPLPSSSPFSKSFESFDDNEKKSTPSSKKEKSDGSSSSGTSTTTKTNKKSRPNKAGPSCHHCRRNHIGCDGNRPCSNCVRKKRPCFDYDKNLIKAKPRYQHGHHHHHHSGVVPPSTAMLMDSLHHLSQQHAHHGGVGSAATTTSPASSSFASALHAGGAAASLLSSAVAAAAASNPALSATVAAASTGSANATPPGDPVVAMVMMDYDNMKYELNTTRDRLQRTNDDISELRKQNQLLLQMMAMQHQQQQQGSPVPGDNNNMLNNNNRSKRSNSLLGSSSNNTGDQQQQPSPMTPHELQNKAMYQLHRFTTPGSTVNLTSATRAEYELQLWDPPYDLQRPMYVIDTRNFKFVGCNEMFQQLSGYTVSELQNMGGFDILPERMKVPWRIVVQWIMCSTVKTLQSVAILSVKNNREICAKVRTHFERSFLWVDLEPTNRFSDEFIIDDVRIPETFHMLCTDPVNCVINIPTQSFQRVLDVLFTLKRKAIYNDQDERHQQDQLFKVVQERLYSNNAQVSPSGATTTNPSTSGGHFDLYNTAVSGTGASSTGAEHNLSPNNMLSATGALLAQQPQQYGATLFRPIELQEGEIQDVASRIVGGHSPADTLNQQQQQQQQQQANALAQQLLMPSPAQAQQALSESAQAMNNAAMYIMNAQQQQQQHHMTPTPTDQQVLTTASLNQMLSDVVLPQVHNGISPVDLNQQQQQQQQKQQQQQQQQQSQYNFMFMS